MLSANCGDFTPSTHGFAFSADELLSPPLALVLNNGAQLSLDQVTHTLSGGMSFAAADYYRASVTIPVGIPVPGDDFYEYLLEREIDSLDQTTIAHIIATMDPSVPSFDVGPYSRNGVRSRARTFLTVELPRILADIRLGYIAQLCLISAATTDARMLGALNRQVSAYAYDVSDTSAILHIYDPHYACDDNVALTFTSTGTPQSPVELTYSTGDIVAGFFYVPYAAKSI